MEQDAGRLGHAETVSAADDVDSEEEAFQQMVLTVDTSKRDALICSLAPHLRVVAERADSEQLDGHGGTQPVHHSAGAKCEADSQGGAPPGPLMSSGSQSSEVCRGPDITNGTALDREEVT